jgi:hypothetical protein
MSPGRIVAYAAPNCNAERWMPVWRASRPLCCQYLHADDGVPFASMYPSALICCANASRISGKKLVRDFHARFFIT